MVVALKARERNPSQRVGKRGELMGHKLVGERVALRGNTNSHAVAARKINLGKQVGHGFPNARTRLDRAMRRGGERIPYLQGHLDLLRSRLVTLVQPRHHPVRAKRRPHLVLAHHLKAAALLGRIAARLHGPFRKKLMPQLLQRERSIHIALLEHDVPDNRPERPLNVLVHLGEKDEHANRQVA